MLDIDEKEPTIVMNKVKLSQHAIDRAKERFGIKDHNEILRMVKCILENGEYLGETIKGDSKGYLYTYKGKMVLLNKDTFNIVTVMYNNHEYFNEHLKDKFVSIGTKEIRKLNRQERALCRKLNEFTLNYNVQMALLEQRIYKTRSENVVEECECEKNNLKQQMRELKTQIRKTQEEKRRAAYYLSLVI